jgi:hypothetical protein
VYCIGARHVVTQDHVASSLVVLSDQSAPY